MEYVNSSSLGEYVHGNSYGKGWSDGYNGEIEDLDDFQPDSDIMLCLGKLEEQLVRPKDFPQTQLSVSREYYPEAYQKFELMASAAIQDYNKQSRTSLFVGDVQRASTLPTYPTRTRLTFTAIDGSYTKPVQTYQAEVDGCVKYGLKVVSCNPI